MSIELNANISTINNKQSIMDIAELNANVPKLSKIDNHITEQLNDVKTTGKNKETPKKTRGRNKLVKHDVKPIKSLNQNEIDEINNSHMFIKLNNDIKIEYKPIDVTISTMTIICKLNTKFNVDNISKYIDLGEDGVVKINYRQDISRSMSTVKTGTKQKNRKNKNQFYNQTSLIINTTTDNLINVKLFINGSIQMTGCKSISGAVEALYKLVKLLSKDKCILNMKTMEIEKKTFVDDKNVLNINNYYDVKIAMINSNFDIGFKIDRYKLYVCMTNDKLDVSFDRIIHAGVILRHIVGDKTISIFIFESGSIVITGAKDCAHIDEAYIYINKYILKRYKIIVKTYDISDSEILRSLE